VDTDKYRVKPGSHVNLGEWDADDTSAFKGDKDRAEKVIADLTNRLEALQELLYAEHKHKVLIVLQAMDTGGKDGTIRHVFEGVNPQGVKVASFGVPTPRELAHDYLWRVHQCMPGNGEIVIFNRSHYEDVLVVRVHNLVPPGVWQRRYAQINEFERIMAEEGTTILKFYLHISRDEQKKRLQERLDDPDKRWKFKLSDVKERQFWPDYIQAYADALSKTSAEWAPWYIVPADHKWYRNLVVGSVIVTTLEELKMSYPPLEEDLDNVIIE
jgi:PPK2 family polyphosphate:nucleotide phosphotransferase